MKLWRPFKDWHPIMKAGAFMLPASATIFLNQLFTPLAANIREVLIHYYQNVMGSPQRAFEFIYLVPLQEEAVYRWPALALLCAMLWLIKRYSAKWNKQLTIVAYVVSSVALIALTGYWATFHDFPVPVFCYGLVWGWLILYTKNPLYSWLFHSICNTIAIGLIFSGYYLIC